MDYKELYRKNYIPKNEFNDRCRAASEFAIYLSQNIDSLDKIWDWFLNFYFNGLDEESKIIPFEEDLKKFAKEGYTVIPLIFHEAIGNIAKNSPLGVICDLWDSQEGLDDIEKEIVIEILEDIKLKTESFRFFQVNWDYFFNNCWETLFSNVFETLYGTTYTLAVSNIVNYKINKILKKEGLSLEYIKEIPGLRKLSCIGIDMKSAFPQNLTYADLEKAKEMFK